MTRVRTLTFSSISLLLLHGYMFDLLIVLVVWRPIGKLEFEWMKWTNGTFHISFITNWSTSKISSKCVTTNHCLVCIYIYHSRCVFVSGAFDNSNNAKRNQMWSKFSHRIDNIPLQECHSNLAHYKGFTPFSLSTFFSLLFVPFYPNFIWCARRALVLLWTVVVVVDVVVFGVVTIAVASCFYFSLMLQRMYSNWMDDGIFRSFRS